MNVRILIGSCAVGVLLLAGWELAGAFNEVWVSRPSLIAVRLAGWVRGDLAIHVGTTLIEIVLGLVIGVSLGLTFGVLLGMTERTAIILQPLIVALYSIPLVTIAPLLIVWFGLGMQMKIFLVAAVSFFLIFFTSFIGARSVDRELIDMMNLMGAGRRERFVKLYMRASMVWAFAGLKVAFPYALVAATVGEMLAGNRGIGFLISHAAAQIDMTGMFAALFVLMLLGVLAGSLTTRLENRMLRWRHANA